MSGMPTTTAAPRTSHRAYTLLGCCSVCRGLRHAQIPATVFQCGFTLGGVLVLSVPPVVAGNAYCSFTKAILPRDCRAGWLGYFCCTMVHHRLSRPIAKKIAQRAVPCERIWKFVLASAGHRLTWVAE